MGKFSRVGKAEAFGRGNYFPNMTMTYLVAVLDSKIIDSRNNDTFYCLEVEIKKVLVGEIMAEGKLRADSAGVTVPTPGEKRSWMCNLSNDAGPSDMRRFAELVWSMLENEGEPTDEQIEELCEHIVDEKEKPLAGTLFKVSTYNKKTRAGNPFTIHDWSKPTDSDLAAVSAA